MYKDYFGFRELPFSIAPDPKYLYLSGQHREALAHLLYGVGDQGGFVLLTGEVGTGKTTVCRSLLEQLPEHCDLAYVVNPRQSVTELLRSICDEFGIYYYYEGQGENYLVDLINEFLLNLHAKGRNAILLIDEAQNLSVEVLEQLRLLTNLETNQKKLLQLILIGQPELKEMLSQQALRQLGQRITARFHLEALSLADAEHYISHRLELAAFRGTLFDPKAIRLIHARSRGIPRLINVICDRCLLAAYSSNANIIDSQLANSAMVEVLGEDAATNAFLLRLKKWLKKPTAVASLVALSALSAYLSTNTADTAASLQAGREVADAQLLVSEQSSCDSLPVRNGVCKQSHGTLKEVLGLGVPVSLTIAGTELAAHAPHKINVDAHGVDDTTLALELAPNDTLRVTLGQLNAEQVYSYSWFWEAPETYREQLSLGESDELVQWLQGRLDAFNSERVLSEDDGNATDSLARGSEALNNRMNYLISSNGTDAPLAVVSTTMLKKIEALKSALSISEAGLPPELIQALVHQNSSVDESLAMITRGEYVLYP